MRRVARRRTARSGWHGMLLGVALLGSSVTGCTGEPPDSGVPSEEQKGPISPRLESAWPVSFASQASISPYVGPGWVAIAPGRNYRQAATSPDAEMSVARAHAEAAGLFRHAALVSGNAAIETYAKTPQPTDPVGAAHLLTIGYALNGDLDKARAASARLDGVKDVTSPWHAPWATWLASGDAWPPDLSTLDLGLGAPTPGAWPELENLPHYSLPNQTADARAQPMGDPGALVALAMWHEAAAIAAAGSSEAVVHTYIARHRLPVEPAVKGVAMPQSFMYASDMLDAGDGPFLADLMGDGGVGAVDAHEATSLTAHLAKRSRGKDGKIDAELAVDVAAELRQAMLDLMVAQTDGTVEGHHRSFADMARVGLLRNLALVAELEDNREQGGKLRILAMEASHEHTGCTVALMSLAAWDVGNRYPSRAQEIIHRSSKLYPSLEAARFGLDVLALRVSRERVQNPGY